MFSVIPTTPHLSYCNYDERDQCETYYKGNECTWTGDTYYCTCNATGFIEDKNGRNIIENPKLDAVLRFRYMSQKF